MNNILQFQPVPELQPYDLVEAARRFIGVPYSMRHTFCEELPDGTMRGHVDCVRLPLRVAQMVGLLPQGVDFSLRRPPDMKLTREELLWELLHNNFVEILPSQREPGDLLLMNWRDVDAKGSVHHVAFYTSHLPAPHGSLLEALDRDNGGTGCVSETRIDALTVERRLDSVWRLKQFI